MKATLKRAVPAPPRWERARTSHGLRVVVCRRDEMPVARLRLLFAAGAAYDPDHAGGMAALAAPLLRAANRRRPLDALERLVEAMGADVVTEVDWESASLTLDILAQDAERALEALVDFAATPAFPQQAIDALRARRLAQFRQQASDPAARATDRLFVELFPAHRYGVPLPGTADVLSGISRDDITRFHASRYTPRTGAVVATGDVNPDMVLRCAERFPVAAGEGAETIRPSADTRPIVPAQRIVIVDCPRADRTELRLGRRAVDQSHPDALALQVVAALLGGTSFSRLSRRLRRAGGYCYFVHCRFVLRRLGGAFLASANVATEVAGRAAGDMLDEIGRLRAAPVDPGEAAAARSHVVADLVQSWGCLTGQADRLSYVVANDLPDDYFERCVDAIRTVCPDRLLDLSRKHLSDEQLVVVAAGPARQLREQLERLAGVREIECLAGGR